MLAGHSNGFTGVPFSKLGERTYQKEGLAIVETILFVEGVVHEGEPLVYFHQELLLISHVTKLLKANSL